MDGQANYLAKMSGQRLLPLAANWCFRPNAVVQTCRFGPRQRTLSQRVVARHLPGQVGLEADEGDGGGVTPIQRFGSAASLNIHLHCRVLGGVTRCDANGAQIFIEAAAPSDDELHALLQMVITRLMKMLTRRSVLVEELGQIRLVEPDANGEEGRTLRPLQAAAIRPPQAQARHAATPRAFETTLPRRPEGEPTTSLA